MNISHHFQMGSTSVFFCDDCDPPSVLILLCGQCLNQQPSGDVKYDPQPTLPKAFRWFPFHLQHS